MVEMLRGCFICHITR